MVRDLANKTVIITGASRGVGAAAARLFHREGGNVVLVARSESDLNDVARALGDESRAFVFSADVTDTGSLVGLLDAAEKRFGAVHVIVNNAGFNNRGHIGDSDPADLACIVDINLKAPVLLSRLALPYLKRAGGGSIVNVASLAGIIPMPDEATYSATKSGLRFFTFSLAEELRGTGISVSAVSPGPIDTEFIMNDLDGVPDYVFSQPMSTAEQVAELIVQCAKDGKRERTIPLIAATSARVGSMFPVLTRILRPLYKKRGARVKERYRNRRKQ